jgi:hypothetical protein
MEGGDSTHRRAFTFPGRTGQPWPLDHPGTTDRLKGAYGVADATALRAALDPARRYPETRRLSGVGQKVDHAQSAHKTRPATIFQSS